jgi:hypothetical protein
MFLHPSVHLELARQRHQDLSAAAERHRIAKAFADRKARRQMRAGRTSRMRAGRASDPVADESWLRNLLDGSTDAEVRYVRAAANHFAHRESDDVVVDLFWSRTGEDEFRVEVEDRREDARFVLYPTTGKEAIHAFHHPFAVARPVLGRVA